MKIRHKYHDQETINDILESCRTIAVVGLSSQKDRAGYYVPSYMQRQGYRIIPVNPFLGEQALGETVYASLLDVPGPVDLVLIFRRSEAVPPFVQEAIKIGAHAVWMQLGVVNVRAAGQAREAGLEVVMNACIMVEHRQWAAKRSA